MNIYYNIFFLFYLLLNINKFFLINKFCYINFYKKLIVNIKNYGIVYRVFFIINYILYFLNIIFFIRIKHFFAKLVETLFFFLIEFIFFFIFICKLILLSICNDRSYVLILFTYYSYLFFFFVLI